MSIAASAILLIALFAYVFWPDAHPDTQRLKTRLDYLRERKESVYDNLRDLSFEYNAGKYPLEDYEAQRAALENEAANLIAEIEVLERTLPAAV